MKINAGEIRVGMLLEYKNDLWQVLKTQHVKPGKGGAFAQVEMKSVGKNTKLNERFRSSETVEKASLEETKFNYLYKDESYYFFMDPKNFEQIEKFMNRFKKEIKLLKVIGDWSDIAMDLDSGIYETSLLRKKLSEYELEEYLNEIGYKLVNGMLTKKISVTKIRKTNKNYSK